MNGIINEPEFRELASIIEAHSIPLDGEKLLMVADPYNHQQITFSQCVTLFSSEMITEGEESLSVLQKLSREV